MLASQVYPNKKFVSNLLQNICDIRAIGEQTNLNPRFICLINNKIGKTQNKDGCFIFPANVGLSSCNLSQGTFD